MKWQFSDFDSQSPPLSTSRTLLYYMDITRRKKKKKRKKKKAAHMFMCSETGFPDCKIFGENQFRFSLVC